jgi:hypothetical protein
LRAPLNRDEFLEHSKKVEEFLKDRAE